MTSPLFQRHFFSKVQDPYITDDQQRYCANIMTIPSGHDFLQTLAEGLLASGGLSQNVFHDGLILLPTRRSVRRLSEKLIDSSGQNSLLMPNLQTLGDMEEEETFFELTTLSLDLPPAINRLHRQFELSILVKARDSALGHSLSSTEALALTRPLIQLMDEMDREEIHDLSALSDSFKQAMPIHISQAVDFLEIVNEVWPKRLKELGMMNPVARRIKSLSLLADHWHKTPPDFPVLAAGSTASIPATAKILSVISKLEQGAVVLPGFDRDIDEKAWQAIDTQHPQMSMKAFLKTAECKKEAVRLFPFLPSGQNKKVKNKNLNSLNPVDFSEYRRRFINEALRPAETTEDWQERVKTLWQSPVYTESHLQKKTDKKENLKGQNAEFELDEEAFIKALRGLSLVSAPTEEKEAFVIALALRETLETESKTALFVSPDITLAKRVAAYLKRWNILPDSSLGESILTTQWGRFFLAILDWLVNPFSPIALLNLLYHPFNQFSQSHALSMKALCFLDRYILRGVPVFKTYQALRAEIESLHQKRPDLFETGVYQCMCDLISGLENLWNESVLDQTGVHLSNYTDQLIKIAEYLSDYPDTKTIWQGQEGSMFSEELVHMIQYGSFFSIASWSEFSGVFREVFQGRLIRTPWGMERRIQILGVLEARLMSADLVILGGVNEGVWPDQISEDPFLSHAMRSAIGLSIPEKRLGLMAHDFVQLVSHCEVLLTRSEQKDNNPVLASRWLWRIKTLISGWFGAADIETYLKPETDYLALAYALDRADKMDIKPALPPEPQPALKARWPKPRGRVLSVTELKTLIRDPYAFYARRILGLVPLEVFEKSPSPAEWGTALHDGLEDYIRRMDKFSKLKEPDVILYQILYKALIKQGFSPSELALENPGLKKIVKHFVKWEQNRRKSGIQPLYLEAKGIYTVKRPKQADFFISVRADRLDIGPKGIEIIDYKTGETPSQAEIKAGFDLQLPIEAALLIQNGFEKKEDLFNLSSNQSVEQNVLNKKNWSASDIHQLFYLKLSRNKGVEQKIICQASEDQPSEKKSFSPDEAIELSDQTVKKWLDRFDQAEFGYPSQIHAKYTNKSGDYDHLARRKEWSKGTLNDEG